MWLNIKKLLKLLVFNAKFSCVVCAVGGGVRKQNTAQVGAKCWRRESRNMLAVCGCMGVEVTKWSTLPLPRLWRAASRSCSEHQAQALEHPDAIRERCHAVSLNGRNHPPTHTHPHSSTMGGTVGGECSNTMGHKCQSAISQYFIIIIFFFVISELKMLAFVTYRWQLILIEPDLWHKMLINMFSVFINNCLFEIL